MAGTRSLVLSYAVLSGHKHDGSCTAFNIVWAKLPQIDVAGIPRGDPRPSPTHCSPERSTTTGSPCLDTARPILPTCEASLTGKHTHKETEIADLPRRQSGNKCPKLQRDDLDEHQWE